jgi:hypothetical protein
MKHRFVLLLAILGFGTLVCALIFSRDNKLQYQAGQKAPAEAAVSSMPANAPGLSPTIETLSEVPAPAAEAPAPSKAEPRPEADKQPLPKATAAKAKG